MRETGPFTGNFDIFKSKTWNLGDQLIAFSCGFARNNLALATFIEPTIVPLHYTQETLKTGHSIQGDDITVCLLNQALEYFQKALYNFTSHYLLSKNGYGTWSSVTNYYSSYFSIFSLLTLQGRAITRVRLNGTTPIACLLHPIDFQNHSYLLTTKEGSDATHRLPWRKYYDIYNQYPCLIQHFEIVQLRRFVTEPIDETEERNKINYKIYEGFQEALDITMNNDIKTNYLNAISSPSLGKPASEYLDALYSLCSDADYKYFARSAMRLILIKSIFNEISALNPAFGAEITRRIPIWQQTLLGNYQPPNNYFEDFLNTCIN